MGSFLVCRETGFGPDAALSQTEKKPFPTSSWSGSSGPPVAARARGGGPEESTHDICATNILCVPIMSAPTRGAATTERRLSGSADRPATPHPPGRLRQCGNVRTAYPGYLLGII